MADVTRAKFRRCTKFRQGNDDRPSEIKSHLLIDERVAADTSLMTFLSLVVGDLIQPLLERSTITSYLSFEPKIV